MAFRRSLRTVLNIMETLSVASDIGSHVPWKVRLVHGTTLRESLPAGELASARCVKRFWSQRTCLAGIDEQRRAGSPVGQIQTSAHCLPAIHWNVGFKQCHYQACFVIIECKFQTTKNTEKSIRFQCILWLFIYQYLFEVG